MKLFTIQPVEVLDIINKTGVFVPDPTKTLADYEYIDGCYNPIYTAYRWLADVMRTKISNSPKDEIPVWAWVDYSDVDLLDWGEESKNCVIIHLEIPDDQVVLSNIDDWECIMLGLGVNVDDCSEGEEAIRSTWPRCLRKRGEYSKGEHIQATFWRIKREDVVKVEPLVAE